MNAYLLYTENPQAYYPPDEETPSQYAAVVETGTLGASTVLDIYHSEDPTLPGDSLIGGRDREGAHVAPFDLVAYEAVRPLANQPEYQDPEGNTIREGLATLHLKYHKALGWKDWLIGTDGNRYPDENPPYYCECRLLYNDIFGWFPRFEVQLEDNDVDRNPSVRNFRIFSSPDCIFPGEYLYQLGALQFGDSLWHMDENGDPLKVWFSESNQFTSTRDAVHFALYWSEYEEGRFTLEAGAESVRRLFWGSNQSKNKNMVGPFAVDTDADGLPDMAFELHLKARKVWIYINGDPKPEFKIPYDDIETEVDDMRLREAILRHIRRIALS